MNDKTPTHPNAPAAGPDAPPPDTAPPGPPPETPAIDLPERKFPDLPAQGLQIRPAKKAGSLTALIADERSGRAVQCLRLHPRITHELALEAGQLMIIRPLDEDGHAELLAEFDGELTDPS